MNTEGLTRTWGRAALQAKRNSPHIFFAAGLGGAIASAVLACRATLKLEKELDAIKTDFDSVRETKELIESSEGEYTKQDYAKELSVVYFKTSITIVKLYAPAIILGSASVAALSGSHVQLTRRNAALSGSLAMLGQAFNEYRERIQEEIGEERELEIYRCMDDNEIEIDGKKLLEKTKNPDAPFGHSPFAVCFDERSKMYQKNIEMNRVFINLIQNTYNQRLTAYGHVFLNDVYDALGLPKTQAGQVYGWVRFPDDGDGRIDFVPYETYNTPGSSRPTYDRSIWLDFNVDPKPILSSLD